MDDAAIQGRVIRNASGKSRQIAIALRFVSVILRARLRLRDDLPLMHKYKVTVVPAAIAATNKRTDIVNNGFIAD